jgi:hypothetical protein
MEFKQIKIYIKTKTNLIVKLEDKYKIDYYQKKSFLASLFSKDDDNLDIYFHQGSLTQDAIDFIKKAKVVIVNTIGVKKQIVKKIPKINLDKIEIVYPYVVATKEYDKQIKQNIKDEYNIKKDERIIFFTAKDLTKSGIQYLFKILDKLYAKNFKVIIESSKQQIEKFRLQLNRMKLEYEVILLSDYKNKDDLFILSDIFVYPTQQQLFLPNILKAMYFKNAVFLPDTNYSSEIIDTFSVMRSLEDPSTSFRVDSLLMNKKELKNVQKENKIKMNDFSLENQFEIVQSIINKQELEKV